MAEALDFAALSIASLVGFAVQVVQVMCLIDVNNLEARVAKRQSPLLDWHKFRNPIVNVILLHWI
jgi:hypothetical protein